MHYLTILISSLLAALGFSEPVGQTSVTRISGSDALLSRVTASPHSARFQCVQSDSGSCTYRVFSEHCEGLALAEHCERQELLSFSVTAGAIRQLDDLPADFSYRLQTRAQKEHRRD